MKTRIYLRIAKGKRGSLVRADIKPNYEPISTGSYNKKYLATVQFALDIDISDKEFEASRILLDAKVKETIPAVDIKQVLSKEENK